tara:strand:- start:5 stop:253 length:249 start_codon:yes stop_codon:yes gene_type:complete
MNTVMVYFVSALVITTSTPPMGWMQYQQSYSDLKICQQHIKSDEENIKKSLRSYLGNRLVVIQEMHCLTFDEAEKRNTKLGH